MIFASGCFRHTEPVAVTTQNTIFFTLPHLSLLAGSSSFPCSLLWYLLQIDCSFWLWWRRLTSVRCVEKNQPVIHFFFKHASLCQHPTGYDEIRKDSWYFLLSLQTTGEIPLSPGTRLFCSAWFATFCRAQIFPSNTTKRTNIPLLTRIDYIA